MFENDILINEEDMLNKEIVFAGNGVVTAGNNNFAISKDSVVKIDFVFVDGTAHDRTE